MKLQTRFIQLPLVFDAELLTREVAAIGEDGWRPHPQNYEGNDFLPLVSVNGEPENESFRGPMRPTPYLQRSPYIVDVLTSLGLSIGRTRLMRLSGHAEVEPHTDIHYYWRDRMRVHVPIVTQPTVRFECGDAAVNMKAGECWIFDTWSTHRVLNDAARARIHLVIDTVGGDRFWKLLANGRADTKDWTPKLVRPFGASIGQLEFETVNTPTVMNPWEARDHITFLLNEAAPNQPALPATMQVCMHFLHTWRAIWSSHAENQAAWPAYRRALDEFVAELQTARAETLALRNGSDFVRSLFFLVIDVALNDGANEASVGEIRIGASPAAAISAPSRKRAQENDVFDRPVFVVNPPRSGSTFLFETMTQAPNLFTVGGESHGVIEGMPSLSMPARNWDSNRLTAENATPEIADMLRSRFASGLRDRDGRSPAQFPVRLLEKTPKNSLRVPFMDAVFPGARFVYLYRDVREVLASMMEAWESGRFRTYPTLPGWEKERPWSLLLTPGWRDLTGLPLNRIVAAQWTAATKILLDDLDRIPPQRRAIARYDALVADPETEIRRICAAMELDWDRTLGKQLPLSAFTVSQPRAEKWRSREAEIMEVLPGLRDLADRVASFAAP